MMNNLVQLIPQAVSRLLQRWINTLSKLLRFPRLRRSIRAEPQLPLANYVTVVIPALNEAKRIADVVAYALSDVATAQVIVIDDSSIDETAALARAAGAMVITSSMLGKGASMRDGLEPAQSDLLVYLDGDLAGLRPGIITDLCLPILQGSADLVKAKFGRDGGRVTELTAKPMLKIFFPELVKFSQPLGGIIAAKKSLLKTMRFEDGYGVDVGLLIDAHLAGAKIAEVDIGSLEHDSQSLASLALMANEVGRVIFNRAKLAGRLHADQVTCMLESQRMAEASIGTILKRRNHRTRVLLLDMDTIVTQSSYTLELARMVDKDSALTQLFDAAAEPDTELRQRVANLFHNTHKNMFEQVARLIEIRAGVIAAVNQMRRQGFMVGVISDSYFIGAEIIRRRIFADFAIAHWIGFDADVCTGQFKPNPAFLDDQSASQISNKANVLSQIFGDEIRPVVSDVWVVSSNRNDTDLLCGATLAFTTLPSFAQRLGFIQITSLAELGDYLPSEQTIEAAA